MHGLGSLAEKLKTIFGFVSTKNDTVTGKLGIIAGGATVGISAPMSRYSVSGGIINRLRSNIISNGGTVSESDLVALRDPLDRLMRSSAWGKLLELWVPVGNNMAAALVKIKSSGAYAMTGNNLVDSDYSRIAGVTGNGTNKDISTGFSAASYVASWGVGVYPTNGSTPNGSAVLCGDGSASYVGFGGGDSKISGSASLLLNGSSRFQVSQNSPSGAECRYSAYKVSSSAAPGTLGGGTLRLLSHAGSLYAANSIGGWAVWSPVMTDSELAELSNFFDSASFYLGRNGVALNLVIGGDSNAAGFGLGSPSTQRWGALLSSDLGLSEVNNAISGSAMSSTSSGSSSVWAVSNIANKTYPSASFLAMLIGTNDVRNGSTAAGFAAEYETWLNAQFKIGYKPGNVILVSPVAATDALSSLARIQSFGDIVRSLASKYGCIFVDGYAATTGSSNFQGDLLHLSASGHSALKSAIMSAIANSLYSWIIRA